MASSRDDDPTEGWSAPAASLLRPGPDFDLDGFDRASTPGWEGGKAAAAEMMAERGVLLSELQERLFAQGRTGAAPSVLLIVQGMDTSGKGGIVRHVIGMVDPQGVSLRAFGVPTPEELRHHYLWRIRRALPRPGMIGVFDRSHYEDVLVVRVDELVEESVWSRRYAEINRFERQIADSGTVIVKVALVVSRQEQGLRLMERLDRPDKHWKFNPSDVDSRLRWADYQDAYADVFAKTSTEVAPWHVIPADRKWYARLAVTELLTQAMIDLDLRWPRPRWRVEVQRQRLAATMNPDTRAEAADRVDELVDKFHDAERTFVEKVREADADGLPEDAAVDAEANAKDKKSDGKKADEPKRSDTIKKADMAKQAKKTKMADDEKSDKVKGKGKK